LLELEGVVSVLLVVVVNALVPTETSSVELATEALVAEVKILGHLAISLFFTNAVV
jgi:hypothetical protein